MISDQTSAFYSYMTRLLSTGRIVFSREEAQKELGISAGALLDAAERQQRKQHLINPRSGFYVVVPPQYLSWGAPPPAWYIDDLMRHEGHPYYVGLLKAAELHGATHHAVMEFQVVTDKRIPKIRAGRSAIAFYYRRDIAAVSAGIQERKTDTGYMKISSAELTLLDLLRYPNASGGMDNIATVVGDVSENIDANKLADLSAGFERSIVQRLGYLMDRFGNPNQAQVLHDHLQRAPTLPWTELEPSHSAEVDISPPAKEKNDRWHVIVRRQPEPDE